MEPTALLANLFDKKKLAVLRLFVAQPDREWTLQEVSKSSRVSLATTYRLLNKLVDLDLLEERKIKHLKMYVFANNAATKYLSKMLETSDSAIDAFVEEIKSVSGVSEVILHGKQTKEKSNVLVIGSKVDSAAVNDVTRKIREKFNYTVITLVLDPEQYAQMVSMGLYSGTKKVLFSATPVA